MIFVSRRYTGETVRWDVRDGPGGCQYRRWWAKSDSHRGWKLFVWPASVMTPVLRVGQRCKKTKVQGQVKWWNLRHNKDKLSGVAEITRTASGKDNSLKTRKWSHRWWNLTIHNRIAHNLTKWPWTLRNMTLTLTCDLDVRARLKIFLQSA